MWLVTPPRVRGLPPAHSVPVPVSTLSPTTWLQRWLWIFWSEPCSSPEVLWPKWFCLNVSLYFLAPPPWLKKMRPRNLSFFFSPPLFPWPLLNGFPLSLPTFQLMRGSSPTFCQGRPTFLQATCNWIFRNLFCASRDHLFLTVKAGSYVSKFILMIQFLHLVLRSVFTRCPFRIPPSITLQRPPLHSICHPGPHRSTCHLSAQLHPLWVRSPPLFRETLLD